MDLTVAAAYMETTNEALRRNAETSVLVHETKLIKEEIKKVKAEGEAIVATIATQSEKNSQFRDNIKIYENNRKEISDVVSPKYIQIKNRRTARTYHVRAEVCEKIRETVRKVNLSIHKSAKETIQAHQESKPITNMLLNKSSNTEMLDTILKG